MDECHTPYDHMNEKAFQIPIHLDALADMMVDLNYGEIRFLAALVRARRRAFAKRGWLCKDELSDGIEEMLKKGYY